MADYELMRATIAYVTGDATAPIGDGPKIIAHVVNDCGGWGAGFVVALSRRWPQPEAEYRGDPSYRQLGMVQVVEVAAHLFVANMCAQHGFASRERPVAVDYAALGTCLDFVAEKARHLDASVHAPRFGAGLAGGRWPTIEALITQRLVASGVSVTIYDLP